MRNDTLDIRRADWRFWYLMLAFAPYADDCADWADDSVNRAAEAHVRVRLRKMGVSDLTVNHAIDAFVWGPADTYTGRIRSVRVTLDELRWR